MIFIKNTRYKLEINIKVFKINTYRQNVRNFKNVNFSAETMFK